MMVEAYPLFAPPEHLAMTAVEDWSRHQADEYMAWMTGCLDQRVRHLLRHLRIFAGERPELLLQQVGVELESELRQSRFREAHQGEASLSAEGYALAADAGLLVANQLMAAAHGRIHWEVLRKPKSAQSFNLPVLVGFDSGIAFDPVAASIAQATGVLRGTGRKDRWLALYEYWRDRS
jgi:hypothetical protein